jgi:hypothetical protein
MTETQKFGWGAAIQGKQTDIADWEAALKKPFEPWVESYGNETFLRSMTFDELETAPEVRDRAVAYIGRLNGAMALSHNSGRIRFAGGVTKFTADGARHQFVFPEGVEAIGSVGMLTVTTGSDGPPTCSEVQLWAALADSDDLLDDALIYFGTATEWFDIYKTLETLILRFGSGKKDKQKEQAFLSLNWAPRDDVKLLKQASNWARHARRKNKPPPNPMKLPDARTLVGQLLRRALSEANAPKDG